MMTKIDKHTAVCKSTWLEFKEGDCVRYQVYGSALGIPAVRVTILNDLKRVFSESLPASRFKSMFELSNPEVFELKVKEVQDGIDLRIAKKKLAKGV